MIEPTAAPAGAATTIFNLPDYQVIGVDVLPFGQRRIRVGSGLEAGCRGCGTISQRRHSRRFQRVRDVRVAGPVEVLWRKGRFFCDEIGCPRKTFAEATPQVAPFSRSTARVRTALVDAVITSGRSATETATAFGVSWWLVQRSRDAAVLEFPDVGVLAAVELGIDEHRYRSVRFFQNPSTKTWTRYEPGGTSRLRGRMSTIVDLDSGQVLGVVDGRDSTGIGDWLKARPLAWRLGMQVVAIDPSAAFRQALHMWLPRTAVSVDAFHLSKLANSMVTEVRQRVTQETKGRRGRSADPVWANRRLLLKGAERLSDRARNRLEVVFAVDDPTGRLETAWRVKEALRALLGAESIAEVDAAKATLKELVDRAGQPETARLFRTVCRWWDEIEVLIVTGATTAKVEANNTAIKNIKRTGRGFVNSANYKSRILLRSAARTAR